MKTPPEPLGPMRFIGAGLEFAGTVLGCMLVGHFIDRYTGTEKPWGLVAGALVGLAGGLFNLIRLANQFNR